MIENIKRIVAGFLVLVLLPPMMVLVVLEELIAIFTRRIK